MYCLRCLNTEARNLPRLHAVGVEIEFHFQDCIEEAV